MLCGMIKVYVCYCHLFIEHNWLCTYLHVGQAASVYGLCISPAEFKARLGEFSHYCPASLAQGELVDCSEDTSLQYSAEFRYMYVI